MTISVRHKVNLPVSNGKKEGADGASGRPERTKNGTVDNFFAGCAVAGERSHGREHTRTT
jgi:hypothetical protein